MKLKIEIDCDNAAFGYDHYSRMLEVHRILQKYIRQAMSDGIFEPIALLDYNGNRVGVMKFVGK